MAKKDEFTVVFDVSRDEWLALTRRGQRNDRYPEQEAASVVRRVIRRELQGDRDAEACHA